ncbi:lecithin retinol acyltransferase family protein [Moritella sp. 24]|uniref:lecithin retinol acyltransferase family protein n=1 Tax=Moritella sp. 24 TaxID=2746230 RepID=UPI001BAC9384|nr:lecithin retinol acyltransferase family protein [Moritella sp. 24]QUM76490.1 lecithin retinol acyltransferase family protein [Moritella sp. 24]
MKLRIGDHLLVSRKVYTHHGIYVGNNQVIHYSGLADGLQSGPVLKTSLTDFTGGEVLHKREYQNPSYSRSQIVNRAESRLGELLYNVHSNNCEHFCCWTVTGKHTEVVETIVGALSPMGEIISNVATTVKAVNTGDTEIIKSSTKKMALTTAEKTALAATTIVGSATAPIVAPIAGVGYMAIKLYRKLKN